MILSLALYLYQLGAWGKRLVVWLEIVDGLLNAIHRMEDGG
jgi:hypothetical protein